MALYSVSINITRHNDIAQIECREHDINCDVKFVFTVSLIQCHDIVSVMTHCHDIDNVHVSIHDLMNDGPTGHHDMVHQ